MDKEDFTFELDNDGKVIVTPQNDKAREFLEELFGVGCLSVTMEEFAAMSRIEAPS